jgi:hypothetical protein
MKKSIMIDGHRYENRETVKYYWTWNKDKNPAAQLMVDGGKLVLEDENIATPCRSVADADDLMEHVLMWYRSRADGFGQAPGQAPWVDRGTGGRAQP